MSDDQQSAGRTGSRRVWRRLRYSMLIGLVMFIMLAIRAPGNLMDTRYEGKSLWDWLDLLIIPLVLAVAAYWLTRRENELERDLAENRWQRDQQIAQKQRDQDLEIAGKERETDREIALEKRNEDILQNYLDKMTELMRDEDWLVKEMKGVTGEEEDEQPALSPKADRLFDIARVRTVSTLRALEGDTKRQTSVIHFLREAELLTGEKNPAVLAKAIMQGLNLEGTSLTGADLQSAVLMEAKLQKAVLYNANLQETVLMSADLQGAVLVEANLQGASLMSADLQGAVLVEANLQGVSLIEAKLQGVDLWEAKFDKETSLPDNTKWLSEVDLRKFTDATHPEFWEPEWVKVEREKGEGRDE